MSRRWFGTDGIRGRAGVHPLDPPFLHRLGLALGEEAGRDALVLMARDTRESGPGIVQALSRGLVATGARVVDLGVLATPGLPLAMRKRDAALGVVVSASHNPWSDNGVKVFGRGGEKLSDAREEDLERRIHELEGRPDPPEAGRLIVEHGANAYVDAMLERFEHVDLTGTRLVVDCAHGAAIETAPRVLSALGATLTVLCDRPDGRNINFDCGSTHLSTLRRGVEEADCDLGLAFDGDADRVLMVDAGGRTCSGDHMLGFLGVHLAAQSRLPGRTVVATVMSNLGLERTLAAHELALHRAPVGDRHVLAAMRDGGYALGGEDSGHLLFADHGSVGDGLVTALVMLEALQVEGRDLVSVVDGVVKVPQVLLNVPVTSRPPVEQLPGLTERARMAEREHAGELRVVLRYSGTENLARVMVEGLDEGVVRSLAGELGGLWSRQIEAHAPSG